MGLRSHLLHSALAVSQLRPCRGPPDPGESAAEAEPDLTLPSPSNGSSAVPDRPDGNTSTDALRACARICEQMPSTPHLSALRETFGWSEAAQMVAAYRPPDPSSASAYAKALSGRPLMIFAKGGNRGSG